MAGENLFGSENSLIGIVAAADKAKYNVHAVLPQQNGKYFDKLKPHVESITTFSYSWRSASGPKQDDIASFEDLILEKNIGLVHSNTIALQAPLIAAKNVGVPNLVHCREIIGIDPDLCISFGMNPDKIISQVQEEADYYIANSDITKRALRLQDRCFRIYNEIDTKALDIENDIDPRRIYVGLIGSNIPKKGIAEFVRLARLAEDRFPNLVFRMIGPETRYIKKLKHSSNSLPNNMEFIGYQDSPLDAISKTNIVLNLSTFAESFGRTIAEAMAARRPVIAYEWGAIPELFSHGNEGFLIPYLNYKEALPHLELFSKDPKTIRKMGIRGRERAVSNFSRHVFEEHLNSAYGEVLSKVTGSRELSGSRRRPERKDNTPLNIAYFVWHFPVPSETFVLNELRYLVNHGYDVRVYCRQSPFPDFKPDFPIRFQRVNDPDELAKALLDEKCDIVHSHFTYPTVTDFVWPACEKAGVDFTFIAHAQDIFRYENDEQNKIGLLSKSHYCRSVLVPGKFHRDYLIKRSVLPEKIVVNPQGIESSRYVAGIIQDRKLRKARKICSVQRFVEKKGLEYLIEAGKYLADDGIEINIYGYGPLEEEFKESIKRLRLGNVFLRGPIKGIDELLSVFRQHDLFVSPSIRAEDGDMDGIPTILMEAMAAGLPVITTAVSSIPDLVKDRLTGLHCRPKDVQSIVSVVRAFYDMPSDRVTSLIDCAQRQVTQKFSTIRLQKNLLRIWGDERVDIVVVSWNNLSELKEVLRRIFDHTTFPFNLTIVDNNSTESGVRSFLKNLVHMHENVTTIFQKENIFVGPGTNVAFEHTNEKYCIYVCGKEGFPLQHGWEAAMINYMEENPEVGIAGTLGYSPSYLTGQGYIDGLPKFSEFRNKIYAHKNNDRVFRHVQGGLFIIRRKMYDEIGGFSETVPHNHTDVEYSYFAESKGWKLGDIPEICSVYHLARPDLVSRIDENILAVHPGSVEVMDLLDSVASGKEHLCNICGWYGEVFAGNAWEEECPSCKALPADRTVFRYLTESNLTYRRLKGLCVNASPVMESIWKEQFQGSILSSEALDSFLINSGVLHEDKALDVVFINEVLGTNLERNARILKEVHRVLSGEGLLLLHNRYDGGTLNNMPFDFNGLLSIIRENKFSVCDTKLYCSEVLRFDSRKLLICRKISEQ